MVRTLHGLPAEAGWDLLDTALQGSALMQGFVVGGRRQTRVTPVLIEAQGSGSWLVGNSYFGLDLDLTQGSLIWLLGSSCNELIPLRVCRVPPEGTHRSLVMPALVFRGDSLSYLK